MKIKFGEIDIYVENLQPAHELGFAANDYRNELHRPGKEQKQCQKIQPNSDQIKSKPTPNNSSHQKCETPPQKNDEPRSQEKYQAPPKKDGFDIMSLLPLLNSGGDLSAVLPSLLGDKMGNSELGKLLPLLANLNLGGANQSKQQNSPAEKTINLENYKRIQ